MRTAVDHAPCMLVYLMEFISLHVLARCKAAAAQCYAVSLWTPFASAASSLLAASTSLAAAYCAAAACLLLSTISLSTMLLLPAAAVYYTAAACCCCLLCCCCRLFCTTRTSSSLAALISNYQMLHATCMNCGCHVAGQNKSPAARLCSYTNKYVMQSP